MDVARGSVLAQVLFLGMTFVLMGVLSDGVYAYTAGSAAQAIRNRPGILRGQRYLSGGVYIGLGLLTAFGGSRSK